MEKYFDPNKRNFGFTKTDIFDLLLMADESINKSYVSFQGEDREFCEYRIERELSGKFAAPSYMGDHYVAFKYTLRETTCIRKGKNYTEENFWVELDD